VQSIDWQSRRFSGTLEKGRAIFEVARVSLQSKVGEVLMYLVRHALVDLDVEDKIRGTQNVPLNEEGEREAQELADFFRDLPISAVYSDDLDRAYHTAIAIAEPKGLKVRKDILLRSWDVGSDLEGKSIDAHRMEIREFKMQPHLIPTGGEAWAHCEERAMEALLKYTEIGFDAPAPIVLVLHGSMLQLMWDHMGMEEAEGDYDHTPIEPSGVIAVYSTRHGYDARILRGAAEALNA
jgi:broad specificity phosphatase PhoE